MRAGALHFIAYLGYCRPIQVVLAYQSPVILHDRDSCGVGGAPLRLAVNIVDFDRKYAANQR
jgi:hypothetical protein